MGVSAVMRDTEGDGVGDAASGVCWAVTDGVWAMKDGNGAGRGAALWLAGGTWGQQVAVLQK